MKQVILTAVLFLCQMVPAQEITKNLGDFSTLKVFDRISVTLVKSGENKISIKGDRAEDVELVQKGDELKIRMRLTKLLQGEDIEATLYYKNIDEVEAAEGSYVGSEDTFKQMDFEISAKSGALVKLKLDVDDLETDIYSGGEAELYGSAANHEASISAGGTLKARNLVTKRTEISIKAGGEADIHATDSVEAKTTAGGDIDIYGNPKKVNQKTTAGGSINIRE